MTHCKNRNLNITNQLIVLLTLLVLAFVSCKEKEEKTDHWATGEPIEEEIVSSPTLEIGCYQYNKNDDFINLKITNTEHPVTGNLTYAYSQKDKNTGTFTGELNNGKLIGTYTFQSEGRDSKRQVAFLLHNHQLTEGYGELSEDGTMFKDLEAINYNSPMPLTKTDCTD